MPLVAFDLYFKVGSRDDPAGRAGLAHYCEHLYGDGSPNLQQPISAFYRTLGGTSPNWATTTEDITHYFGILPANQLETILWVEGDRLARPFALADSAHVATTRPVMMQERLSRIENPPVALGGAIFEIIANQLFPEGHPYFTSSTSPVPDMPKITASDVRETCAPYYVPRNAVLSLSGDFNSATAKKWIEKYFGAIPRGAEVKRKPVPPAHMGAEKRAVVEDFRAAVPQLRISWIGASYADPDRIPLLAFASTLSLSRFAEDGHLQSVGVEPPTALGRLSKVLVDDRHLANRVVANDYDLQHSGVFGITVYPRAGASLTTIETLVDSVIAAYAEKPVTKEELALFNAYNEVYLPTTLQPKFMHADTLAHDEIFAGDPLAWVEQAQAGRALTAADIERARKRFLVPARLVLSIVPAGKLDLIAKPEKPYINITPSYAVQKR